MTFSMTDCLSSVWVIRCTLQNSDVKGKSLNLEYLQHDSERKIEAITCLWQSAKFKRHMSLGTCERQETSVTFIHKCTCNLVLSGKRSSKTSTPLLPSAKLARKYRMIFWKDQLYARTNDSERLRVLKHVAPRKLQTTEECQSVVKFLT